MRYRRVKTPGISYFFTVVCHRREKFLQTDHAVEAFHLAVATVQSRHPFEIEAEVILPDHLHALWTLPDGDAGYPLRWRRIKEEFTRWHVRQFGEGHRSKSRQQKREQAVWQRRYWEHAIRDDADFVHHAEYIHFNPVKHGLVEAPRDWPHSSFHRWVADGRYDIGWGSDQREEIAAWRARKTIREP